MNLVFPIALLLTIAHAADSSRRRLLAESDGDVGRTRPPSARRQAINQQLAQAAKQQQSVAPLPVAIPNPQPQTILPLALMPNADMSAYEAAVLTMKQCDRLPSFGDTRLGPVADRLVSPLSDVIYDVATVQPHLSGCNLVLNPLKVAVVHVPWTPQESIAMQDKRFKGVLSVVRVWKMRYMTRCFSILLVIGLWYLSSGTHWLVGWLAFMLGAYGIVYAQSTVEASAILAERTIIRRENPQRWGDHYY